MQCRCIGLDDIMADAPASDTAVQFADYVLENDIAVNSKFPPILWTKPLDLLFPYTNNGAVSYHSHLNEEFYVKHPNIYVFVDVLKKISKQRMFPRIACHSRHCSLNTTERRQFVVSAYDYRTQLITRKECLKKVSHRYGPRTELRQCS